MNFAAIIRSPGSIRNAFSSIAGLALWWRIVLALHGKPVSADLAEQEKTATLARGFRFYGLLYRGLGGLMALGAGAWILADASYSRYWGAVLGFGALYLIASSSLAFRGADALGAEPARGAALLVSFFVSIMVFLAAFGAMLSSWAHQAMGAHDLPNASLFAGFILFGIGSYLLEVLYLVCWKEHGARASRGN